MTISLRVECGQLKFRRQQVTEEVVMMLYAQKESWTKRKFCNCAWIQQWNQDVITKESHLMICLVAESLTNGHIPVVSHHCEKEIVNITKN